MKEKSPFEACYMCSWCELCFYDEEDRPRCKNDPTLDCSEVGELADCGIDRDGEADCADFDPIPPDPEPDYEEPYDDYDGRYDTIPSIFDRL